METLLYTCGCDARLVGQAFERGQLVCPVHKALPETTERSRPFRGRVSLELGLEAEQGRVFVEQWLDGLCETLLLEGHVQTIVSSLEWEEPR